MELKKKLANAFDKAKEMADKLVRDKDKIQKLVKSAWMKAEEGNPVFKDIRERFEVLLRMVSSFAKGRYKGISTQNIVVAVAGLLYLVNPLDLVPDFIPGLGLLDDAAVLAFVVSQLDQELTKFRTWEVAHGEKLDQNDAKEAGH